MRAHASTRPQYRALPGVLARAFETLARAGRRSQGNPARSGGDAFETAVESGGRPGRIARAAPILQSSLTRIGKAFIWRNAIGRFAPAGPAVRVF